MSGHDARADESLPLLGVKTILSRGQTTPDVRRESTLDKFRGKYHGAVDDTVLLFGVPRFHATATIVMIVLIIVGACIFHVIEGWSWLTAFYVIVQIVTTVGYGDLTVHNSIKVFMAIYACSVMILGSYYLSLFTQRVHDSAAIKSKATFEKIGAGLKASLSRHTSLGKLHGQNGRWPELSPELMRLLMATLYFAICTFFGTWFYRWYEHCSCSYGRSHVDGCDETDFATCEKTGGYVTTWATAFYMSILTLLTIGFGDHAPKSWVGRLIGIFWILLGVSCTANFVAAASESLFKKRQEARGFGDAANLIDEKCDDFEKDGQGIMSRAEFINFMLIHHNMVSIDIIDQLNEIFDDVERLDGTVDNSINIEGLRAVLRAHDRV